MAGVFCEGFDIYNAVSKIPGEVGSLWSLTTGRAGVGQAIRITGTNSTAPDAIAVLRVAGAPGPTIIYGGAMNLGAANNVSNNAGFGWLAAQGGAKMICMGVDALGIITVRRGGGAGNILITADTAVSLGAWFFVELVVNLATDTSGSVQLYINGVLAGSASGVQTSASGTKVYGIGFCPNNGSTFDFDDWYLIDDTSPGPVSRLGDVRVGGSLPHADTDDADFELSDGSEGWSLLQDADDDSSYLYSDVPGYRSLFKYSAPADKTIHFARIQALARKEDAGGNNLALVVKSGSAEEVSDAKGVGVTYGYAEHYVQADPADGAPFVTSTFQAAEFGVEIAS